MLSGVQVTGYKISPRVFRLMTIASAISWRYYAAKYALHILLPVLPQRPQPAMDY
jgi:hypothetical protein